MSVRIIEGHDIQPQTQLWRYMELSKFMLLLQGRVFIPTLKSLKAQSDPKEAVIP
jgi:hypothetical protein